MRRLGNITDSMDMNLSKLQETEEPGMLQSVCTSAKCQTEMSKWTTTTTF